MKKLFTLIAFCTPLFALAQIEKGKPFVSGSIGLSTANSHGQQLVKSTSFSTQISGGYLLTDRFAVGINPSFQRSTTKYTDGQDHGQIAGISVFARRYFALSERFYFHLDAGLNFESSKIWNELASGEDVNVNKASSYSIYLRPGASYFLTDKVALQAYVGNITYTKSKYTNVDDGPDALSINFNVISLNLGASFYF